MKKQLTNFLRYLGGTHEAHEYDDHYDPDEDLDDLEDDGPAIRKLERKDRARDERPVNIRTYVNPPSKVHLARPKKFEEVQAYAKKFKQNTPVILNIDVNDKELARRIFDFTSGLVFGLDGQVEDVGGKVFLLTPKNVEVSAEERRQLKEKGFFEFDRMRRSAFSERTQTNYSDRRNIFVDD